MDVDATMLPPAEVASDRFHEEASLFKAIADENRMRILATLASAIEDVCVCDFTGALPLNQPTVSHHLRILREAGLVTCERRGTWVYYRLPRRPRARRIRDAGRLCAKGARMKVHLSLATSDLAASVAFYSALLDREPRRCCRLRAVRRRGSGIELALALTDRVGPAGDAHFGICATSPEDVERAILRLSERGLATSIERNHTCCYAKQTKSVDLGSPRTPLEVYAVLEESPAQNDTAEGCCAEPCGCAA